MDKVLESGRRSFNKKNISHACDCFWDYLERHPDDSDVRMELRDNQRMMKHIAGQKKKWIDKSLSASHKIKIFGAFRNKKGDELIRACEEQLFKNPFDVIVLKKLFEETLKMSFNHTAIELSKDIISLVENRPEHLISLQEIGQLFYEAGLFKESHEILKILDKLFGIEQSNDDIRELFYKILPARIHISNVEKADSFRDSVNSIEVATKLENAEIKTKASFNDNNDNLLRELETSFKDQELDNIHKIGIAKKIAEIHCQKKEFDLAIKYLKSVDEFDRTYEIKKRVAKLIQQKFDTKIAEIRKNAKGNLNDELNVAIEKLEHEKWELLIQEYEELVKLMPSSDPELHLKLGEGYYHLGIFKKNNDLLFEAIAKFQFKYTSDIHNYLSGLYLGKSYRILKWHKLAIEQFKGLLERFESTTISLNNLLETAYELANACQDIHDTEEEYKALSYIIQRQIKYRDARERFQVLSEMAR